MQLGWNSFALQGGFNEWKRLYGAEPAEPEPEATPLPALDTIS